MGALAVRVVFEKPGVKWVSQISKQAPRTGGRSHLLVAASQLGHGLGAARIAAAASVPGRNPAGEDEPRAARGAASVAASRHSEPRHQVATRTPHRPQPVVELPIVPSPL